MTTTNPPAPAAFTRDDFAARMSRVVSSGVEKGLAGVIVTPGPDLVWLTGYQPTAITERLTMLVLSPDDEPTLLLPVLELPDAEAAEGVGSVSLVDWEDGTDPYEVASPLLRPDGEFGISDSAWAMHVLGLQRALPKSSYRAITESLPMMRAVKDSNGIGVTTHEPPYMVEGEEQPLVPGMCFSVEPGIYLAGRFGVRIEDIVTVTADGGRRLNNTDHGLRVVE